MVKKGYIYIGTHYNKIKEVFKDSIISPIFANIYLNKLDKFIKNLKSKLNLKKF